MAATQLPTHVATSAEANAHTLKNISADGTITVTDATTGQPVVMRLAGVSVSGTLTLVAVGPGSS
jgi:hypothetical protein